MKQIRPGSKECLRQYGCEDGRLQVNRSWKWTSLSLRLPSTYVNCAERSGKVGVGASSGVTK